MPARVPPLPNPENKTSTLPFICSQISAAWSCNGFQGYPDFQTAGA
jgi:hypothetical protein